MLKKRGQITAFIIIGVIIAIISVIIFFIRINNYEENNIQSGEIYERIQFCIDSVAMDSVYFTGLHGGYYNIPDPKENYSYIEVPIYWNVNSGNFPTKEKIETEMMKYISDMLPKCINSTSLKEEYNITLTEVSGSVNINENNVIFNINYPISIEKSGSINKFQNFNSKINMDFGKKYEFARMIFEQQNKNKNSLPMGFITNLAYENDFKFEIINLNSNEVLITLISNQDENRPFIYAFINKYGWKE